MFSLADKGQFFYPHKQHFGYTIPNKTDPSKVLHKPFYCVEQFDYKTKTVVQHCPECDKIKTTKDRLETVKKKLQGEQKTDSYIKEATTPLSRWLSQHNLENRVYFNVKYADGTFGTIKLPWKVKKELDNLIAKLLKPEQPGVKAIDPIAPEQGVWFELSRRGKGLTSEYSVVVVMETLNVNVGGETMQVKKEKLAPLTAEEYETALKSCYDLTNVGIPAISREKVQMLVESSGEGEIVEAVFNTAERVEESPAPVKAKPAKAAAAPVMKAADPEPTQAAEESPAVQAAPVAAPPVAEASMAPMKDPMDMDEEEFKRYFGG